MRDKYRHELKERPAHQKTQPTDRYDMDQDQGLRCLDWGGGVSKTRCHQAFGHNQRDKRRGEIRHRPAG
jgi:hypothetical protein